MNLMTPSRCLALACLLILKSTQAPTTAQVLELHARQRQPVAGATNQFQIREEVMRWEPHQTAVIICDMWDQHWCQGATARVSEMAPRMNDVIKEARRRGVLIIHAPSETMTF